MTPREALLTPFRQRYPFLPLLAIAIGAILLAEILPCSSLIWLGVVFVGGILLLLRKAGLVVLALGIFAAIHLWQSRESPEALLARELEQRAPPVDVVGRVCSEPRVFTEDRAGFRLKVESLTWGNRTATAPLTLLVDWKGPPPSYGDEVRIRGALKNLESARNPGQFDFAAWSQRHGVYSRVSADKETGSEGVLKHGHKLTLFSGALATRDWMKHTLEAGVNDPAAAELIVAMVLGDTTSLSSAVADEFRGTGTYHLFSVSGLHVGILAWLLWMVFRVCGLGRRSCALSIIPLLFFYTIMTGFSPASVRSAIMGAIVLAGFLANRKPVLFNNLCAAGFLILLGDTNQLYDAGFQLSFTVVAAIVLLAEPIAIILKHPFQHDEFLPQDLLSPLQRIYFAGGRELAATVAVSLAAWVGSFALIVFYFHLISLSTLPANLVAVPVSFGIMAVSLLSLISGIFSPWLASVFNQTNWALAKILLWLVHVFATLPGSYFYTRIPEVPSPLAEVVVFDFGTGGASYIRSGGGSWLIDCGPANIHDRTLAPFLRSEGLTHLSGLILTQDTKSHSGALSGLLGSCPPKTVLKGAFINNYTRVEPVEKRLPAVLPLLSLREAGDKLAIAPNATFSILYPPKTGIDPMSAREHAMVILFEIAGTRLLFTSDAPEYTEQWLLKHCADQLSADLLIEGSSRNDEGPGEKFLTAANPRLVIQGGSDAFTSRPNPPEFLKAGSKSLPLFAQDNTGAVFIRIYADHFVVSAFAQNRQYSFRK